jgi:uncharacterized protein
MGAAIFVLPVLERWLVHAPRHGVTALVNTAAVESLKEGRRGDENGRRIGDLWEALETEPPSPPQPRHGPLTPEFMGLIPIRACNLACVYCGFGAATAPSQRMSLSLAVSAVDWMAEQVRQQGRETLEVHFFGGEPFCAGEVVEVAVHRARAVAARRGLIPRFEVATNGVFDEDRARFVGDYFDTVVLSFDGPLEVHDRHRPGRGGCGSFDAVARTAHWLGRSPVELCFRVCVTQGSVAQMEEIARWFCEEFHPSVINFETLQPTPESEAASLQPPDPWEFAVHCVRACQVVAQQGVQPVYAAALTEAPRLSFCPVGNDTLIVSPEGRVSACYLPDHEWQARGLDLDLGCLENDGTMRLDPQAVARARCLVADKPRCERCFCRWSCASGCHVNHSYPGCSPEYDAFCLQTRLITACRLLSGLGCEPWVDALLDRRAALEALALQPSDCLEDWEGTSCLKDTPAVTV